jgi:hypothetical protein
LPKLIRDRPLRPIAPTRRDQLLGCTRKVTPNDREQTPFAQLVFDQESRHVPPGHALENELLLHLMIGDGTLMRAFYDEVATLR